MSYYRTCPDCGANLDPGERCDCQVPVKQVLNKEKPHTAVPVKREPYRA